MKKAVAGVVLAIVGLGIGSAPAVGANLQSSLSHLLGASRRGPSSAQMAAGIRQVLAQGGDRAIRTLGRNNGFLGNPQVRIPVPPALRGVASVLRRLGQGQAVDQFVRTLNRAAERAVPLAAQALRSTVTHMTVRDAVAIVRGPNDAATRYFETHAGKKLSQRLLPIVRQTTARAGVTRGYKRFMEKAGPEVRLMGIHDVNLDRYVTQRTLHGLYRVMAQEEKRIRQHPLARTTQLLRQVFGARA